MNNKVSVATTWLQSCSGCHISFLDLHEELLDILEHIDIKYSPIIDIKEVPQVNLGIVEGAVCNKENEEILKTFREKSEKIIAFGTCACFGGIAGLRNLFHLKDVLDRVYKETESTKDGKNPSGIGIPELKQHVQAINQVIDVDYYIPGCPPLPSVIKETLMALVKGEEPEIKTRNLCEECDRKKNKMLIPTRDFVTEYVVSPHELDYIDLEICFLEQGVLCMGPATVEGCKVRCIKGNMPCRGCMGPTPDALEQGSKIVNALSSILPSGALMFQEDVVGVSARYSLPVSIYPYIATKRRNEK